MDRLFERIGYASQWIGDLLQERAAAVADRGEDLRDGAEELLDDADHLRDSASDLFDGAADLLPEGISPEVLGAAASAAGAWVASRYLSRGRVRWSRAVIAGVAGTLVYEILDRAGRALEGGLRLDPESLRRVMEDPDGSTEWGELGARFGGGVALALFYAGYLHHRLPGPAPVRGALFGGLDAAALRFGGLLPLLERLHPDLELPSGFAALSDAVEPDRATVARHLAFGVTVALAYGSD